MDSEYINGTGSERAGALDPRSMDEHQGAASLAPQALAGWASVPSAGLHRAPRDGNFPGGCAAANADGLSRDQR